MYIIIIILYTIPLSLTPSLPPSLLYLNPSVYAIKSNAYVCTIDRKRVLLKVNILKGILSEEHLEIEHAYRMCRHFILRYN